MSEPKKNEISIVSYQTVRDAAQQTMFPITPQLLAKTSKVAMDTLRNNLADAVLMLSTVADKLPQPSGDYRIDVLTFALTIDGSGKVSLLGELSAGIAASITISLKRESVRE